MFYYPYDDKMVDGLVRGNKSSYAKWRFNYLQFVDDVEDIFVFLETHKFWSDNELSSLIHRYQIIVARLDDIRSTLKAVFARSSTDDRYAHYPNDQTFLNRDMRAFNRQWSGMADSLRRAVNLKFAPLRSLFPTPDERDEWDMDI